MANKVLSKFLS